MEINLVVVLVILVVHFIADFVCQTSWQAENKSKDWGALLAHTGIYSLIWMPVVCILLGYLNPNESPRWYVGYSVLFSAITFICHTATDYYTSRVNSMLWEKKKVHAFFVSIGFDQQLHYTQLLLTFYFLTQS